MNDDNYIYDEIFNNVVEKYGLGRTDIRNTDNTELELVGKTPLTNYQILELDDKYYVKVPKDNSN